MVDSIHCLLQALRRFESMSSIQISGAASIADLAGLAVELEQQAEAWRVSRSLALLAQDAHITAQPIILLLSIDQLVGDDATCHCMAWPCDCLVFMLTEASWNAK